MTATITALIAIMVATIARTWVLFVITSYSIHYTKLYDRVAGPVEHQYGTVVAFNDAEALEAVLDEEAGHAEPTSDVVVAEVCQHNVLSSGTVCRPATTACDAVV